VHVSARIRLDQLSGCLDHVRRLGRNRRRRIQLPLIVAGAALATAGVSLGLAGVSAGTLGAIVGPLCLA
jgi:hypothetical protein